MNSNCESSPEIFVSFCTIVKNEQHNLPRCLASIQPYVNEIIVVDTGSEDKTVEVAHQYGAQVQHFTWCDDFAAARNYAITQAGGDWILMLDADEELVVEAEDWRNQLTLAPDILAYWLFLTDIHQPITALPTLRLFRNLPELRYAGRYHEQLKYHNQLIKDSAIKTLSGVKILHYGYSNEQLLEKHLTRDIPLLECVRQQEPLSLLLLGTLADAYLRTDQLEKAQECWAEAFERLTPNLITGTLPEETVHLRALLFTIGANFLHAHQDYETTLLLCQKSLEWFPNYPPLNHLTGILLRELGFLLGATAYFKNCIQMGQDGSYDEREPFDRRFITVWSAYDLGLTYLQLKQFNQAIESFELTLSFEPEYTPAQEHLEMLKNWR